MPGVATKVQTPRLKQSWEVHLDDYVVRLAFSPDQRLLAAAGLGGGIHLLDAATGRCFRTLFGHELGTQCISWNHDGSILASGGQDGRVRMWSPASGLLLKDLEGGAAWVEQVAFAPHDPLLVSAAGRSLKLWNVDGACVREYAPHPSTIYDVQWQHGSPFFTSAAYGQLATFKTDAAEPVKTFAWKGSILSVAWSPDDNYIATGNQDASVHFWYRKSGKDLEMTGYPAKVRELSWDAGSRYLATGGSAIVTIWDCGGKGPAGTKPIQLDRHETLLTALDFQNKGGLIASGCRDGLVCVWNPKKEAAPLREAMLDGEVTQLCWAGGDQSLAAGSARGTVRMFIPAASTT
jgi:WD40 repeat protein